MPNYDKSLNEVQGTLRIPRYDDNAEIPFVDIRIIQKCFSHNIIIAKAKHHVFSKSGWLDNPGDIIQKLLGKKMVVRLSHLKQPKDAIYHAAIITSVSFENNEGNEGDIILNGVSGSALFDRGKTLEAFHNRSWTDLLDRAKEDIPIDNIHINVNPINGKEPSPFLLQFNEDTFAFLCRLAAAHGEWLYHDGQSVCLGRPDYAKKPLTLTYDKDLPSMTLTTQHIPHKISQFSYNEVTNSFESSQGSKPELTEFAAAAWSSSEKNVSKNVKETNQYTSFPAYTLDEVQKSVQTSLNSKAATGAIISGTALTCNANIGRSIIVKIPDSYKSAQKVLGSFVITQTEQYISQRGEYKCEFQAMADIPKSIPMYDIITPQAQSLIGRVCDTEDPKGLGRVLVELQGIRNWAVGFGVWLRVMSPNAGNTASGEKNRGMIFIPEKNDQVIVDFLNRDTSQPFVMGSLYHSANSEGGGENNHIKSIRTKTGSAIIFDDKEHTISIQTTKGNSFIVNEKNGSIEVVSAEMITFSSSQIILNAKDRLQLISREITEHSENMEILVEKSLRVEANKHLLKSNEYKIGSTGKILIIANDKLELKGSVIEQSMGGSAVSPKVPKAIRELTSQQSEKQTEEGLLEGQMLPEEELLEEQEGRNPQILSVKLFDGEGNKTDILGKATNVEVETKNMAGRKFELKLKDEESGEEVHIGDFYIPSNSHVVKTVVNKREPYII